MRTPNFQPTARITGSVKDRVRASAWYVFMLSGLLLVASLAAQTPAQRGTYPALPSETPAKLEAVTESFEYVKRSVMIPMRDGVRLNTVIIVPKGAKAAPILLTRTPYNAEALTSHAASKHLSSILQGYDHANDIIVADGYIRVMQDIRGKHGSEGDYVVNRPLRGPQNPTPVDHATDTYDTIDWLVKNIPESNGKVGIHGISYNGFLTLMALVNPHPALKVAVPMNPMVDGWIGDDWFHNGAFRQQMMPFIYRQAGTRTSEAPWWSSHYDDYDAYLSAGSAGELGRRRGLEQIGFWKKLLAHPSYDAFWRDQAVDKILAAQPLQVPVMIVHSLWDQEDIYGAPAVYAALEPKDLNNDKVFLVMGPWYHGQMIGEGSALGALKFNSNTALYFRQEILRPFLAQHLKDGAPKAEIAPVSAYETGTNTWRRLPAWPAGCASGCTVKPTPLYLSSGLKLRFEAPKSGEASFTEYVSDPAKPVPFRARPNRPVGYYDAGLTWPQWLVDDQREASGRTDVVVFVSEALTAPMKISGQPMVNLMAATSGTDADWVVKLIDVYPDEVAEQPEMGGYQLMVAADIFRGRYRESLETPKALVPDKPLLYRFALPTANHVFLPGHRVMVQVQSSWFPLYDRNPQKFVPNIFWAKPEDYQKARQRVYHAPDHASFIELPLVTTP
ncbi:MAG: CocE/NonD family hydrolase [candidate division KSB1 bacterium]|nr:CocE/NonD family hydrolase [candidate division KSB1 bacterium]MDZ7364263.1 CocE/NonD family hydrolase [candidate division KSB1 bacterium]MDZ7404986.1 CocE/NonD family hydrolase [candidate division KSB1 bacterium]